MPVHTPIPIPRLSKAEFGRVSYQVMRHLFAIHDEFGRFFDERIYKRELALRMPGVRLEVPVDVSHGSFTMRYFLDVVAAEGALFEFKTVEEISPRHRAQLLNYLLLLDLAHGQIVNLRPGEVKGEFVNAAMITADRKRFVVHRELETNADGAEAFESALLPMLEDLGTGLDLALYEAAMTHLLGGESIAIQDVPVLNGSGVKLGTQTVRLCAPNAAFKLTAFPDPPASFAEHCRRLLRHLPLEAIQWANITNRAVRLMTIHRRTTEK